MRSMACSHVALEKGRISLAVIVLIALAAACSGSGNAANPIGPTQSATGATTATLPAAAGSNGTAIPRHVAGTLDGRFAFIPTGDEWWEFYSESDATGTLTHLGLSRMHTRHYPDLTGALREGTFRIVAANGDEIRGTYEGSATYDAERADLLHGVATFVITEGTGRFVQASGSFTVTLLETLDDPTWASAKVAWTLSGTVNY